MDVPQLIPVQTKPNQITLFASAMMRSQSAMMDAQLWNDYNQVIEGHCIYIPELLCTATDYSLMQSLVQDLSKCSAGMINWSQHFKHENPDFSPTFQKIIQTLASYFDVEIYASRLNFYANETAWKPFHHDSHAYGGKNLREDFTIGVSVGASRELAFLHPSGHTFNFPQKNGDVFAFTTLANQKFQHGVPKTKMKSGPRFSVIVWGRRLSLNERNSAVQERKDQKLITAPSPSPNPLNASQEKPAEPEQAEAKAPDLELAEVLKLVESWVLEEGKRNAPPLNKSQEKPKAGATRGRGKSRVQGGWGGR